MKYFEVNARSIAQKTIKRKPPVKGKDVHLTLDMIDCRIIWRIFLKSRNLWEA